MVKIRHHTCEQMDKNFDINDSTFGINSWQIYDKKWHQYVRSWYFRYCPFCGAKLEEVNHERSD